MTRSRLRIFLLLISLVFNQSAPAQAQDAIRKLIIERRQGTETAQGNKRSSWGRTKSQAEKITLDGLDIAVWRPKLAIAPYPLVIFSHGFHGISTQSEFIMNALAKDGYLVVAPNHDDAGFKVSGPQVDFSKPGDWKDSTYQDRRDDIKKLMPALAKDSRFKDQIDWSKVALAGHSLGGYTALSLAGGWPSWKIPEIKAVLALSPYLQPLALNGKLSSLNVPVMYQGGTRDLRVTPFIRSAYDKTSAPVYFVEFIGVNHFGWTNLNRSTTEKELINHYCLAFLNKYVKGDDRLRLDTKLDGVSVLQHKD